MATSVSRFGWVLAIAFIIAQLPHTGAKAGGGSFTIEDYNAALPVWGTSWLSGPSAINGYYPSFYTGFAPRSNDPSRIHVQLARGNQTRVSVILDEGVISDYLYDLTKRYRFYQTVTTGPRPLVNVRPDSGKKERVLPQLSYFNQILESDTYGILPFVESAATAEALYKKGLQTISALNPGRVFNLRLDLTREFLGWRARMRTFAASQSADIATLLTVKTPQTGIALNDLLPGRVNFTRVPSKELLAELVAVARLALNPATSDDEFVRAAGNLFHSATAKKYDFRIFDSNRGWMTAFECAGAGRCFLSYPEFTAIYPTGSVQGSTRDAHGNTIPTFATPGLWSFISRGSRNVDNIRQEPYYGWAPKMDYEPNGNGFHNPAVRFTSLSKTMKSQLNLAPQHNTFWSVKRGGVSHGCSRLPLGHIWEMRAVFPVVDAKMTQVDYFGSDPRDFDVYDVDGNGTLEVMGVEYLISYGLQQADGLGSREGTDLEINQEQKLAFYQTLYGAKDVFTTAADGSIRFLSPTVSGLTYLDRRQKRMKSRSEIPGEVPLYEQSYERDKTQLYLPITTEGMILTGSEPLSKRIIRLMGRVRGCAPSSDREACGEAAFDRETDRILAEAARLRETPPSSAPATVTGATGL